MVVLGFVQDAIEAEKMGFLKRLVRELCFIPSTPRNPTWPLAEALVILYVEFENTKHFPYPTYPVIREPLLRRVREGQDMHIQIFLFSLNLP